ncbi:unnamed protein product [Lactuca virosa]|uniref:Uncharacterized protein n=1 Tax=Lactuca virosa TaxID=75947 RepID=A0AAU9P525_9ASTR|nr:unnamed protein product [Lactuca virosa]
MASKEYGQTSIAKSPHKASQSHATGPSTETYSSSPKIEMVASKYTALLNTQEQPKEFGVIVEYLKKCPLAYALISTSLTPQSLISEVFSSAVISTSASLGLSDISHQPQTFITPSSAQLLTMFKEMGYKFEGKKEPCLSRIRKSCLPTPWHFLSSVLTRCLFGSVGGRSRGKKDLWILMYGLFYDINVDYASILWEDFLNFLPASKNNFFFIILAGSLSLFIMPSIISSFQILYLQSWTKKKRKHSDHASKKSAKKKKKSKSNQPPPISSVAISDDNLGPHLEEPTSLPKSVSPSRLQPVLESPSYRVPLDYDSLEDDDQDDDKQS